jgi:hypothetical protein
VIRLAILPLLLVSAAPAPQGDGGGRPTPGAAWVEPDRESRGVVARSSLPEAMHHRNTAGSDGSGNCVFASAAHAAKFQGIDGLADFHEWMRQRPGGGWPEKFDRMVAEKLGDGHDVEYLHLFGPEAVDLLELAVANGHMAAVTLGYSERYGLDAIDHMVNLVHLDDELAAILDNNFPGSLEWMPRDEFVRRFGWSSQGAGEGWAIVILSGDPQPPEPEAAPR